MREDGGIYYFVITYIYTTLETPIHFNSIEKKLHQVITSSKQRKLHSMYTGIKYAICRQQKKEKIISISTSFLDTKNLSSSKITWHTMYYTNSEQ